MKSKPSKTHLNSMNISNERLSEYIELIEIKTGKQLSEQEALPEAEKLLRLISILFQPATMDDYCSALGEKAIIRSKTI
ncbi:MAG TPA: hypothetical protein VGO63_01995 [Candidatus Paceibacterota bacterium]|jgi:hypothetical protein|nr:hypothetical protein [Candidatus Paceibacterota bacterium]